VNPTAAPPARPPRPQDLLSHAADWVGHRPWLLIVTAIAVGGYVAGRNLIANWRHRRLATGARLVTIAPPPEVDKAGAAAAWTNLIGVLTPSVWRRWVYGTPHLALEYTWAGRELIVRLWVPGVIPPGAVEAAVRAAWPGAAATTTDTAPPIPLTVPAATGGAMMPALPDTLPLGLEHETDPLRPLVSAGAEVRDDEYACVQILARPATARRARKARRAAGRLRTGGSGDPSLRLANGLARAAMAPLVSMLELFLPGPSHRPTRSGSGARTAPLSGRDPAIERDVRAILDKTTTSPLYEIAIRYAVATSTTRERVRPDDRLRGLAHTIASAFAAHTGRNKLRRLRLRHPVAVLASRRLGRGFVVNLTELGFLAGLPTDLAVPGLDRARAKAVPAPPAVSTGGRGIKRLGHAQVGGRSVGIPVTDARHHLHLVGKTGAGKSTLIVHMVVDDVKAGRGAVVIDPRGDMINDILDRLPVEVADRVHIIDPNQERPAYFNPLEGDDPHLAVDNLVGIFSRIFQRHWGPRIDDTLRVACLTLMQHANPTLSLVPPLLNDDQFRAQFTVGLDDPEGLHGYWQWYDSMNPPMRAQVIGPVLARLRAFLLRDFVRGVVGGPTSSFDMGKILDGGLLLVRLPKGVLGEDTARVLGSLVVARVWQAATARATQPEQSRKDATLYVDECVRQEAL
jgi:hypothetical protein